MTLKLVKKGVADQYNDHSRLNNLDMADQHPIKAIIGLQDELDRLSKSDEEIREDVDNAFIELVEKIESGEIGGIDSLGRISISYNSELEYEGSKLVKETFTGDINKTVKYSYDGNGNIIEKNVEFENETEASANYEYDRYGNLIKINDTGTDKMYLLGVGGFSKYTSKSGTIINEDFYNLVDIKSIADNEGINTILSMEILIKNTSSNNSFIKVTQSGVEFEPIIVEPNETHKYDLGSSKSVLIKSKGELFYELSINGVMDNGSPGSGGSSSIPSEKDNEVLLRRIKMIESNLKDMIMANIKMQYKYDKALGIDENYLHGYYIDSGAKTLTKESEQNE